MKITAPFAFSRDGFVPTRTKVPWSGGALDLDRCPHCRVADPLLSAIHGFMTTDSSHHARHWRVYCCSRCGGAILGAALSTDSHISEVYPTPEMIELGLPAKAGALLAQAFDSMHAPSGAIMLCAACVDAMLKEKGLKEGSLNSRIDKAAAENLITADMAQWAHEVRLDANAERHAHEAAELPGQEEAKRCIEFTRALGMFLFTLPLMVANGRRRIQSHIFEGQNSPPPTPPAPVQHSRRPRSRG